MAKSRRITPGGTVVTKTYLARLLHDFARAADASLTVKMETMRAELRAEFAPSDTGTDADIMDFSELPRFDTSPPSGHPMDLHRDTPPTDSEGAE